MLKITRPILLTFEGANLIYYGSESNKGFTLESGQESPACGERFGPSVRGRN